MKVGISKPRDLSPEAFLLDPNWTSRMDLSEWEAVDLLDLTARRRTRISRALQKTSHRTVIGLPAVYLLKDPEVARERFEILVELAATFEAEALLLRTGAQWKPEMARQLQDEASRWRIPKDLSLWMDWGDGAPGSFSEEHDATPVLDPLWHPARLLGRNGIYKLHGWHPSRWIRYYGREQLEKLKKIAKSRKPQVVLFAHSMRNEEALRFSEAVRQSVERECP